MFRDAGRGAFLVVFGDTECLGSGDSSLLRMAECPNRQCGLGIPLNFRFPLTSLCGPWTGRGGTSTGDWGSLVGQALSGSPPLILMTTRGGVGSTLNLTDRRWRPREVELAQGCSLQMTELGFEPRSARFQGPGLPLLPDAPLETCRLRMELSPLVALVWTGKLVVRGSSAV